MKMKIFAVFAVLAGIAILGTGCVKTVSGSNSLATSWGQDRFTSQYERPLDQVYEAAKTVVRNNGVLLTEVVPHDVTNTVLALQGRVNQRNVWVRVEAVSPRVTQVEVQARTKYGTRDLDLVNELDKEIALQLSR